MSTTTAKTPIAWLSQIVAGTTVVARDEEWLVRSTQLTPSDGTTVRCIGVSPFVRDTEATFFTNLDRIEPLDPAKTQLILDESANYRFTRLYLESLIRKSPVPATEQRLAVSQHQLLDPMEYQRKAVHKALTNLRPRMLIADAVGLGKTLEVGMILSELIRRGKGDRILVVTPRHILEQFQHELWTRFAIPLVRLDSEGIQRVRRHIPANRNPFTFYKRVIISIDTLKSAGRYRHHLEGIRWDAVVIDECHNLVNKGTLNNQLARVLAPRTDALLLTSATPHNGDPKSFAELIKLLDPTAVLDPESMKPEDIEHLYVRRHKGSSDVKAQVVNKWADRKDPKPIAVPASPQENALFAELERTWTHPSSGSTPVSGRGSTLFPWTLFKAALSSHHALLQTLEARLKNLRSANTDVIPPSVQTEIDALERLVDLASQIDDDSASKLNSLIAELKSIGVSKKGKRVVIFSERIATLDWLAATVPAALGLTEENIRVLHGGMADVKQMDVIEEFGLADSKVRILFTGDMASEGVNLHRQCHHLIHFDLPWSLITIEQRNGRIDRFGQELPPEIRALMLTPNSDVLRGDVRIITKLLQREHEAHKVFGDSGALLGLHSAQLEEEEIAKILAQGKDDTAIPAQPVNSFDLLALLAGSTVEQPVAELAAPSLFASDRELVDEALRLIYGGTEDLELQENAEVDPSFFALRPPRDLARRFSALPQDYLREQKVTEQLRLTSDRRIANDSLVKARNSSKSTWPRELYLSPLHPFLDWLADKVLAQLGRNNAPVIVADVEHPTVCVQGMFSNGRGQAQIVEWLAVTSNQGTTSVEQLWPVLESAGMGKSMSNPATLGDPVPFTALIAPAVAAARTYLAQRKLEHDSVVEQLLVAPRQRLDQWSAGRNHQLELLESNRRAKEAQRTRDVTRDTQALIDSMRTEGDPMLRVIAVLVPASMAHGANGGAR